MARLVRQIKQLVARDETHPYRRVLVDGRYVLLTAPQARRFEELRRRDRQRL